MSLLGFLYGTFTCKKRVNEAVKELERKNEQLVRSREEIQRSEHKFRLIFENAPYAIVMFRLDDGTILDASKAFLEKRNVSKDDLQTMKILDLFVGSDEEKHKYLTRIENNDALT